MDSSRFVATRAYGGSSSQGGGGAYNQDGSQAEYRHCVFEGNVACAAGGAMRNLKASPLVIKSLFTGNASDSGGGIASTNSLSSYPFELQTIPLIEYCTFVGNAVARYGGAIDSVNASFVVEGCVFEYNTSKNGGAVSSRSVNDHPPCEINESVFRSNSAGIGRGGAVYSRGDIQVANSEFVDNSANISGGAIFTYNDGCILSACLFDMNYAPIGSSLHDIFGDRPLLTDCAFTSCCEIAPPWSFTDGGGNDYQAWCDDCRANVNCLDDAVDAADLAYMLGVWGTSDPQCDITGDGIVDGADLGALLIGWGPCP